MKTQEPQVPGYFDVFVLMFIILFINCVSLSYKGESDLTTLRTGNASIEIHPINWSTKWTQVSCIINCKETRNLSIIQCRNGKRRLLIYLALLLVCGDIEANPGPTIYPCGFCELAVDWSDVAVACDECSIWYHKSCLEMCTSKFENLNCTNVSWICMKCCTINTEPHLFNSFELNLENSFAPLDENIINNTIDSIDSVFSPGFVSSPQSAQSNRPSPRPRHRSWRGPNDLPAKSNWRSMGVNVNHLHHKRAPFEACTNYVKPDVIFGSEAKLDPSTNIQEIFPPDYQKNCFIKYRNRHGGGTFLAIKNCYTATELEFDTHETHSDVVWAKVSINGEKSLYLCSFYRAPGSGSAPLICLHEQLNKIAQIADDKIINIAGDFNCPNIDWEANAITSNSYEPEAHEELLNILQDHPLVQMQKQPTRNENNLDLFLTNNESLVKSTSIIPGISDHKIVVVDSLIRPILAKPAKRKIYKWYSVDWADINDNLSQFKETFLESASNRSVEENWHELKQHINNLINDKVPHKWSTTRYNLSWFNRDLTRMTKRKQRLYNKAKQSKSQADWDKYKQCKKATTSEIRKAHNEYVERKLIRGLDEGSTKPFWRYVKSLRRDTSGIGSLKQDGKLHNDPKAKAEILNNQFRSVFTKPSDAQIPEPQGSRAPNLPPLEINCNGVYKLLSKLNVHKAMGPDQIPNIFLKETAIHTAELLTFIFNQSISTHTLPRDWLQANINPLFKKGNTNLAVNYRPVSLTCVCCKLLEHIIFSHVMAHLQTHNLLSINQHGFRSGFSCETQLILTAHDLLQSFDHKHRVDIGVLDFSKAFDTVPHPHLLKKLDHLGIRGDLYQWLQAFLTNRDQRVVVDGAYSNFVHVESGVPQGTVLGPLLFLCHINDLPLSTNSHIRLFADDCLIYREINSLEDKVLLQKDLDSLQGWASNWGMRFNAQKCYILSTTTAREQTPYFYQLNGEILQSVPNTPYLGVTLSADLKFNVHLNKITAKSYQCLAFVRRNLKYCPEQLRRLSYISLIRSKLEYSSSVWDPHLRKDIDQLEKVQRRAARFIKRDYKYDSSVTQMLKDLDLSSLENRRKMSKLSLLFKIRNNLLCIKEDGYLERADSRTREASRNYKLKSAKTELFKHSFFINTPKIWNNLPSDMKEIQSLESFKTAIRKHLQ